MKNNELDNTYPVLDHGYVKLTRHAGNDHSIIRSARKAHHIPGEDEGEDAGFIASLFRTPNTTAFEAVSFAFEIKAPIFVFQHWNQYREWAYSEVVPGYSGVTGDFYVPEVAPIMTQSAADEASAAYIRMVIREGNKQGLARYRMLLTAGCPVAYARSVLPTSTYANMFVTYDLHSLFNFLRTRLNKKASYESRVYAEAMLLLIEPIVPLAVAAFRKHTLSP